jgi:GT2 family glycosyltransferase
LSEAQVTIVIPTLTAGPRLLECLCSLEQQSRRDFEVIVVDNSGKQLARETMGGQVPNIPQLEIIENSNNAGFGVAINQGFKRSRTPFLATLNDDAVVNRDWLERLLAAIISNPDVGMCASQVRFYGEDHLDSAGMLVCADGSSKQRGHLYPPSNFAQTEEALLPSGSAALYRRAMLERIGLFDEDFFLYCEDTDLGLRARWAGWKCLYVPAAVAQHHYSATAGRVPVLKAYYIERNRLYTLIKNFPARRLALAPFVSLARYWWHLHFLLEGRGSAAHFRRRGHSPFRLVFLILRAHAALLTHSRALWRKRKQIQSTARISSKEFCRLLREHSIRPRQIAEL